MLRYQQQLGFFDPELLKDSIRFINLSEEAMQHDLKKVQERIIREVEQVNPAIVVVDSFRTVMQSGASRQGKAQAFVQQLALHLTGCQATTFLVGEYSEDELFQSPVFTVADGIFWLFQSIDRNSIVRKFRVIKLRGQAFMAGLHTFRITDAGIQVFPRMLSPPEEARQAARPPSRRRVSIGVAGLDEMLHGGIPQGDAVLVAGPSGSGKSVLATQFIAAGVIQDEPGVIAVFEEHPREYQARAEQLGFGLEEMVRQGKVKVIYLRPLDLSVDETLQEIRKSVSRLGAKRVAIDSLSGFELALAPTFREEFRESLYRMVGTLTGNGVTVLMTVEVIESYTGLRFSPHTISFLSDDIILQRYVELEGQLKRVITVAKMRGSQHSKDLREYRITVQGLEVGRALKDYQGIITGVPVLREPTRSLYPGLSDRETGVLEVLNGFEEASVEELARKSGLRRQELRQALERLLELNYALQVKEDGKTVYRPVARMLGK